MCVYICDAKHIWTPATALSYKGTKTKVSIPHLPSSTSDRGNKEGGILDERYVNMYKIPKRGSKVPGYKGGRLPIHKINGGRKAVEVSYICDLPRLYYERY